MIKITIKNILLFILLLTVSYKDFTERRIPNKITFPTIFLGWGLGLVAGGFPGFIQSLLGTLMGGAIFFIPFVLGGMGAGDVKLLAAIGALKGWKFALLSAFYSAFAGLIMSIFVLIAKGNFAIMIYNLIHKTVSIILLVYQNEWLINWQSKFAQKSQTYERTYIPFGIAISVGAILVWLDAYYGFLPF